MYDLYDSFRFLTRFMRLGSVAIGEGAVVTDQIFMRLFRIDDGLKHVMSHGLLTCNYPAFWLYKRERTMVAS